MDLHSHHSVWSSTNGAQPHSAVLPAFCCSAKHQNKKFPKIYLFIYLFLNIIGSVALGVWGLGHGKMTRSITTNHPCLITSAHEKAFPPLRRSPGQSVVGGGGGGGYLDREQSGGTPLDGMVWEYGPAPLFFLKPLPDSIMGREKPQSDTSLGGWGVGGTHLVATTVGIS